MKKIFIGISILAVMMCGVAVYAKTPPPSIQINGVDVHSDVNYVKKGEVMVDVFEFFQVMNQEYEVDNEQSEITTNGVVVEAKVSKGKLVANLNELAEATGSEKVTFFEEENLYYVLALPEGVIQLTPEVPKMGEHWARPQDMPIGPIYGVHDGKLVFLEQMPPQELFINGENIINLDGMRGYPSPSIEQTDIEFQEHGHEGFEVPHYDIHHYFITDEEQSKIGTP